MIDEGSLDCYRNDKHIKVYQPGEAFGELALLYNAPRAATIKANSDSILFALDRECFNNVVKDAAVKKRERYESLLSRVELLESMDPYERSKIADSLKPLKFKANEYVVKEGERGDSFYFVESGTAYATKVLTQGQPPEKVMEYSVGDYFGEISLLRDTPRAASIISEEELCVVSLDRRSFMRLLGPLDDILKRNFGKYEKFVY